jgi:hypothetical protein
MGRWAATIRRKADQIRIGSAGNGRNSSHGIHCHCSVSKPSLTVTRGFERLRCSVGLLAYDIVIWPVAATATVGRSGIAQSNFVLVGSFVINITSPLSPAIAITQNAGATELPVTSTR